MLRILSCLVPCGQVSSAHLALIVKRERVPAKRLACKAEVTGGVVQVDWEGHGLRDVNECPPSVLMGGEFDGRAS